MVFPSSQAVYLLALQRIPRVGAWTAIRVARSFTAPEGWLAAPPEHLTAVLGARFATPLINASRDDWSGFVEGAEADVRRHREAGIDVLAIDDPGYPPLMRLSAAPAAVLYVRGTPSVLGNPDAVALVGTREPTRRGHDVARRLGALLAEGQFTIVSGLAKGIDRAGHEAALDAGGRTVALLGTAIDKIYPVENKPLAARIERESGALVSEYPLGSVTSARQFVERDRLQAGMSIAVIAVQTGVKGGTLHALRFATESRRAVLVPRPMPAEADHPMYGGIHAAIHDGRAEVIEGRETYPRLMQYLGEYRDWLLAEDPARSRPSLDPRPHLEDPGDLPRGQQDLGL